MKRWFAVTEPYGDMDSHSCDVVEVEAETRAKAKALALSLLREMRSKPVMDAKNPFFSVSS